MLWLKVGADWSLLASPENTKVMLEDPTADPVLVEAEAELPEPERRSIQGTATCLPLPAEDDSALLLVVELELELVVLLVSVSLVLPAAPETERTAKSIRPEDGLMMTSLKVPRLWPEEPVTLALLSSEARTCCCCCMRPVALRELPLDVLEELSELPVMPAELWLPDAEPCWEPDE